VTPALSFLFGDAAPAAIPVSDVWGLISVLLPSVLAFLAAMGSWLNRQQLAEQKGKVEELHLVLNSRLTELIAAMVAKARAEGADAERAKQEVAAARIATETAAAASAQLAGQVAAQAVAVAAALATPTPIRPLQALPPAPPGFEPDTRASGSRFPGSDDG